MFHHMIRDVVSCGKVRWDMHMRSFSPFKSPGPDGVFPGLLTGQKRKNCLSIYYWIEEWVGAISVESSNSLNVYTDGSNDGITTGSGVFCKDLDLNLELAMGSGIR